MGLFTLGLEKGCLAGDQIWSCTALGEDAEAVDFEESGQDPHSLVTSTHKLSHITRCERSGLFNLHITLAEFLPRVRQN